MQYKHIPSQIHREFLGVCGLIPWVDHDSSSRVQMFSSHIGQTLVIKGATERYCQTGMEREYAKYTFSTKMPVDAQVIKVIERYRPTLGKDAIRENPQTIVIYEEEQSKRIGVLSLTRYCSYHQYFGFEYRNKPARSKLVPGEYIKAGTVLQDSPAVTDDGGYKYGIEANIAFMTHPAVSEDGVWVSRDFLPKLAFKTYETRVVEFSGRRIPLNLYGDATTYKPFPDIGDVIREDGLLMALRPYDENLAGAEMSVNDLQKPDPIFDKLVYAGGPGGRVVDIRVHHDRDNPQASTPMGMEQQAQKYDEARRYFYQEIYNEYLRLRRLRGEALVLTPEFNRLVIEAISVVGTPKDGKRIVKLYRQAPLDDWRVEFVIEYEITPTIGFKLTDTHGGKGVICHISDPEDMPVDADGNRADLVMDPNSIVSRMNLGRPYEQYTNAARRDVAKRIRTELGIAKDDLQVLSKLTKLEASNDPALTWAWDYLLGFYKIVTPATFVWMTSGEYRATRSEHLAAVIQKDIFLYMPPDSGVDSVEMVMELEKYYRPTYGPVTYRGNSGRLITTKKSVRIGSVYIILLEKIGDDWTAVSSGKLQTFGMLAQVTNSDKYSAPSRTQAIRALGEAELRIYQSYAGPQITADIHDRNNNPATHAEIVRTLLEADRPTNITSVVDRNKIPLGSSKPLQLVKHIAECGGWRFHYQEWVDPQPKPQ